MTTSTDGGIRTSCPDEGTLRAFHDHAAPSHDALAAHVRDCLDCARTMRELRRDAAFAAAAMASLSPNNVDLAVAGSTATGNRRGFVPPAPIEPPRARRGPLRLAIAGTAAALGTVLVITPVGQSVAKNVLEAFRSKEVTAVKVSNTDAEQTAAVLSQLGTPSGATTSGPETKPVADVAAAQKLVSFPIAQPAQSDLPPGLSSKPGVDVSQRQDATFVFSEAKTKQYLKKTGSNLSVPAGLDGEKLTLTVPSAVVLTYEGKGEKGLIVGTAEPVAAQADGAMSLSELQEFLMDVPGVPKSVVNQLGNVDMLHGALPIPIPVDVVRGEDTTVADHSAVAMSQPGLASGVVWQEGERLVGVGGTYDADVIKGLATKLARP